MRKNILFFLTISSILKTIFSLKEDMGFLTRMSEETDYDRYVFAIQWGPTLCHKGNDRCRSKMESIPKNIFTIHGLWPNLSTGERLDKCNQGEDIIIEQDESEIYEQMETFWISFTHDNDSFWTHEYNTHGFCYAEKYNIEDPKEFFKYALGIYKQHDMSTIFKRALGDLSGSHSFDFHELDHKVAGVTGDLKYEFVCRHYNSHQYLQEIRFNIDLELHPVEFEGKGECNKNSPIVVDFQ
jgi:ribonuclease I